MKWEILIEVRVSSRRDDIVEPIKAQLRAMDWVMEEMEQTLNWTKITYKVEVDTNVKAYVGIHSDGGDSMFYSRVSKPDPDSGGGTHESHFTALRKGKRKPAIRMEHRKRRGKNKTK